MPVSFRAAMAAMVLVCAAGAGAQAGSFCRDPALDAQVAAAAQDRATPAALSALAAQLDPGSGAAAPDCASTVSYCVGLKRALRATESAYERLGRDPPDMDGARAILDDGRKLGSPWQLLVATGDVEAALAHERKEPVLYRAAATDLQLALNAIGEPPLCASFGEIRPERDDVGRIRKRAEEAVLLSPLFDVARTRSGDCGGIFLSAVRGIGVDAVPVPITFGYNQASFTPEGQKAADALLQCLKEKKTPVVVLTGHTDQHGSDGFNMDLAARRLATVGSYLKTGGFAGALKLIPMGKREPFQPDQTSQHTADELDQMNRRVELRDVKP